MSQKITLKKSELEKLSQEELMVIANELFKLEEAAKNKKQDFYIERMTHVQKDMHSIPARFMCVWAGNRCLSGDTLVRTSVGPKKLSDIQENDLVASFDLRSNQPRYSRSSAAILKGRSRLVRVTHESGEFVAHPKHALFCLGDKYSLVSDLRVGDDIYLGPSQLSEYFESQPRSTLEPCPIMFLPNAPHSTQKSEGSLDDYQAYNYLYDQQPISYPEACLGSLALCSGEVALLKSLDLSHFYELLDNLLGLKSVRNRLGLPKTLFENYYARVHTWVHGLFLEDQTSPKSLEHTFHSGQLDLQSHDLDACHQTERESAPPFLRKSRIKSINEMDEDQDYYDIQVPETGNFFTEDGTLHKNSGKSTGGGMELRWRVLGDHPFKKVKTPIKAAVICTDFENHLKKVIEPKLMEWLPPIEMEKAQIERNQSKALKTIKFRNGSTVDFYSHDQDLMIFESSDYDFVWADEPLPHNIFKAVWRGLTDRGGDFLMTGTPIVQPWMMQEYKKWEAGNQDGVERHFIIGRTEDNAHNLGDGNRELGLKRIEQFAAMLSPDEREARLNGKPLEMAGLVFKDWDRSVHLTKPFEWPSHWPIIESIDPHPRKPAGVSWIGLAENGAKILLLSGYLAGDVAELGDEIVRWRERLSIQGGRRPRIIRCLIDNASNAPLTGRSITTQTRDRVTVREELEAIIGPRGAGGPRIESPPKNVSGKIEALRSWLTVRERDERKRADFYAFDIPENEDFFDEIEGYVWAKFKTKDRSDFKDQPVKRNDDILDSILQVALTLKGNVEKEETIAKIFKSANSYAGRHA